MLVFFGSVLKYRAGYLIAQSLNVHIEAIIQKIKDLFPPGLTESLLYTQVPFSAEQMQGPTRNHNILQISSF